jgi:large-conductance mechanosensitive channel
MYKSKYYKNTVFYRFEEFSKLSVSKFTLTLVIAYLVATVVNGFNRSIMIPIVQSLFPSEDVWGTGVSLPRGAVMYPGLFFLLVVSFFLSLLVVFILAELVYQLLRILTAREEGDAKVAGVVILVGLLIGLMAWNIVDMEHPEKPHITTVPPNIITSELGKKHAIKIREPVNEYKKLLGMASL